MRSTLDRRPINCNVAVYMVAPNDMAGLYKRPIIKGLGRFILDQNELPIIQPLVVALNDLIAYELWGDLLVLVYALVRIRDVWHENCEPSNLGRFRTYL